MIYKIKLISQTNATVLILILLALFVGGAFLIVPKGLSKGLAKLVTILSMISAYFLWQQFVAGITEWYIDNNEIKIVWTKKFFLAKCNDINLKWSEIKNVTQGSDPQYFNLKIKLTSGNTMKFFHGNTLGKKDDFEEMLKTLSQISNNKKLHQLQ